MTHTVAGGIRVTHFKKSLVLWWGLILGFAIMAIAFSVPLAMDSLLPELPAKINHHDSAEWQMPELNHAEFPGILDSTAALCRFENPLSTYEEIAHWARQVKTQCAQATLHLIEGRREDALALTITACRAAQSIINDKPCHEAVHAAITAKTVAVRTLELHIMNAVESSGECARAANLLAELAADDYPLAESFYVSRPSANRALPQCAVKRDDHVIVPYQAACARLQLLRAIVAARQIKLETGAYPTSLREIQSRVPGPALIDPMYGSPLSVRIDGDAFVVYAVGPDGVDDCGKHPWIVEQGWGSSGDIVMRLNESREFAFPSQPMTTMTSEEFSARYPGGLPPDPFSPRHSLPMIMSSARPGVIFSRGPQNGATFLDGDNIPDVPRVAYDPTNGILSEGNLMLTMALPQ